MRKKIKLPIKAFGCLALITIIAIPVLMTTSCGNETSQTVEKVIKKDIKINNVDAIFDANTKFVSLYLSGSNLSSDKNLYKVKNISSNKVIDATKVTLVAQSITSICLSFIDIDFTNNVVVNQKITLPLYEVSFTESGLDPIVIRSSENSSFLQPTIQIDKQPTNLVVTTNTKDVDLTIVASVKTNPIKNQSITYQWFTSQTNDANPVWTPIKGANIASYKLSTSLLKVNAKTYIKCSIGYKYTKSLDSEIISINLLKQPGVSITKQPQNEILNSDATKATFNVGVTLVNPISGQNLAYQWFSSDIDTNQSWTKIDNATSSTYEADINSLSIGTKKYFKCEISYQYVQTVISETVYAIRTPKPVLSITTQPESKTLTSSSSNEVSLSIVASATNQINKEAIKYQWFISDVEPSSTTSKNTIEVVPSINTSTAVENIWTKIDNATNETYSFNLGTNPSLWNTKWYKCEVSYLNALTIISNHVFVKMTLTQNEALAALNTWLKDNNNQKQILTQYFSQTDVNKKSNLYSGSGALSGLEISQLPNFTIKELSIADNKTELTTIDEKLMTWKIELTTITIGKYKTWNGSTFGNEANIPIGSIIQFYLPVSFGENRTLNKSSGSIQMLFSPVIKTSSTELKWTVPSDQIKGGSYLFNILESDGKKAIKNSSILRAKVLEGINSTSYKFIPTFNIVTNK